MPNAAFVLDQAPRDRERAPFASESGLQRFVEQYAEGLLGVRVVASSRAGGGGLFKIDILAEGKGGRPWIIECKHDLVDAVAWRQLRRYRDALISGWTSAAGRFGNDISPDPVLVAIGYRFDGDVGGHQLVRIGYRYHDVEFSEDEFQSQKAGRVSLYQALGAAGESAICHPTVAKRDATIERLQHFAPELAEDFWRVDAELTSHGVKATYGGKNFVRYGAKGRTFAEATIGSGVIEWRTTVAHKMRSSADTPGLLELLHEARGKAA